MTDIIYRKPKKIEGVLLQHNDPMTREYRLCYANQVLGIPSTLISELTGVTKSEILKVYDNKDVVDLELYRRVDRFLAAAKLLEDLRCLPCNDYSIIRSMLGLGYTCRNLEEQLEEMNVDGS